MKKYLTDSFTQISGRVLSSISFGKSSNGFFTHRVLLKKYKLDLKPKSGSLDLDSYGFIVVIKMLRRVTVREH